MATSFNFNVDTTPMANEIKSVSRHVVGTTAAVVTMQSAVIDAENRSAQKVCSNVNRGFFTMMRSQISQKIANKQSRVEALLMQLAQQKRQLLGIKTNMEREYGRIASRYLRIFTNINKELEQRIRQIDQPIFELVNRHMASATNRMNALCSWVSTSQSEGITKSQQIIVSNMKYNAKTALEHATDFLTHVGEQRVLTDKVLISNPNGNEKHPFLIPVMICETISDAQGIKNTDIRIPQPVKAENKNAINEILRTNESLKWEKEKKSPLIDKEFDAILSNSNISSRVKDTIKVLYASAKFESL